jgi:hypothetical protein
MLNLGPVSLLIELCSRPYTFLNVVRIVQRNEKAALLVIFPLGPIDVIWPEPYPASIPDGGAHSKDRVENYLCAQVCEGKISLSAAQGLIVTDWYAVLKQIEPPASTQN